MTTTLTHLSGFLDDVLYQSQWRAQKAAEYPDDERNRNAADHLESMHTWLIAAGDDPRGIQARLSAALDRLYRDPDVNMSFQPSVTDRLGRFGFYHKVDVTPGALLRDLLELIEAIEEHLKPGKSVKDLVREAATDYLEKIQELRDEYLEQKRQAFYEDVQQGPQEDDDNPLAEDELADQWSEEFITERDNFYEMVKEAEADAWRTA